MSLRATNLKDVLDGVRAAPDEAQIDLLVRRVWQAFSEGELTSADAQHVETTANRRRRELKIASARTQRTYRIACNRQQASQLRLIRAKQSSERFKIVLGHENPSVSGLSAP